MLIYLCNAPLREHSTPNQKLTYFVFFLKIINTFLKYDTCIL